METNLLINNIQSEGSAKDFIEKKTLLNGNSIVYINYFPFKERKKEKKNSQTRNKQ